MNGRRTVVVALAAAVAAAAAVNVVTARAPQEQVAGPPAEITGVLTVVWGDPQPGLPASPRTIYTLTDDELRQWDLLIGEAAIGAAGGVAAINRQRVVVRGWPLAEARSPLDRAPFFRASAIRRAAPRAGDPLAPEAITIGPQPWISVPCKFGDNATEPKSLTFFQGMYAGTKPGLDHYWRELSFDAANVAGSGAVNWKTLPEPRSYYIYDQNGDGVAEANLTRLRTDCLALADPEVDYRLYKGINMMFNDALDCCAWGGGATLALDGQTRFWSLTWEPPWAYSTISVIAHEMGHGFGLPHTSGAYGSTYDNPWDVMSQDRANCGAPGATDPVYGCTGQHTNSYHKNLLGWIPAARLLTVAGNESATVVLEQLATPALGNYHLAKVLIPGSARFYTVEARRRVGYDGKLYGDAVIIHEVDQGRSSPALVVDIDGNGNNGDAGAMWTPGETFANHTVGLSVAVNSATATGFAVAIGNFPRRGGDWENDLRADLAVFRPSNGTWYARYSSDSIPRTWQWGTATDRPVPGDYDGDRKVDMAVFRPATGTWFILLSSTGHATHITRAWGTGTDTVVPADYDGDRKTDIAVYRPSTGSWFVLTSSSNFASGYWTDWGVATDVPVPGDYDGDGRADIAVFRPANGTWYVRGSSGTFVTKQWGATGDIPVPADYDGDGRKDIAVFRPSTGGWFGLRSASGFRLQWTVTWGTAGDTPVPADYNADGYAEAAVYRPATGVWYVRGAAAQAWGAPGDIAVTGR